MTDVMNESKNNNLFIRVSEKEKTIIERNAKKCGLSVSEYLRQRALGYMPRAVLPEVFFSFNDKLDELCIAVDPKQWVIDEPAAQTVRKIFALCLVGKGPMQIARQLEEEQILSPAAYFESIGRKHAQKVPQKSLRVGTGDRRIYP